MDFNRIISHFIHHNTIDTHRAQFLIIVESPSKAITFSKFTGNNFFVFPSFGIFFHISHLHSIDSNFNILFNFSHLKRFFQSLLSLFFPTNIFFATDIDREGELISYQLSCISPTSHRIRFNEITKEAVMHAIENPSTIDKPLVLSQNARLILDIFIGHKISPFLWKFIYNDKTKGLSAGRCQTPALRLIYDNEKLNTGDIETKYKISGNFFSKNITFHLNYEYDCEGKVFEFLEKSKVFDHKISLGFPKQTIRGAPLPFNTSSLLQHVSNNLHCSPKETMKLCQDLYQKGLITYIRTEGKKYSSEFLENAKKYIMNKWNDEKYLGDFSKLVNINDKNPHEAIRVVYIENPYAPGIDGKMQSLYHLIWNNTVNSCMADAKYNCIVATISAPSQHKYTHTIEIPLFLGWKKNTEKDEITQDQNTGSGLLLYIQSICKGESPVVYNNIDSIISIKNKHSHYTEASLIHKLEELGIGKPSTFSMIINTIQERGYVKKCDIEGEIMSYVEYKLNGKNIEKISKEKVFGNEKNKLVIQPIGIITIEFLIEHFDSLFSYEYTRNMEEELDKIANTPIELLESTQPWYAICQKCDDDIKRLSKPLAKLKKKAFQIDDEYELIFHQFGASLRKSIGDEVIYKNVKKGMKIDISKLKNKEYTFDDLVEIKNECLGKYEGEDMQLKSGKYGPYVQWGDKRQSIKNIKKDLNDVSLSDIINYIDDIKNPLPDSEDKPRAPPQIASKNILRALNSDISIRKGKFGPYIFYQTTGMQSPAFFGIGKYKKNYATCDSEKMIEWIVSTYVNK